MSMFGDIAIRKTIALFVFALAFLLTPKVWVEQSQGRPTSAATIPVDMLEAPGDCLWCAPIQPVDCEVEQNANQPARSSDRFWLNPDEPPVPSETAPCLPTPTADDETTPSA